MATMRVGKPDVDPGASAHTPGVPEGNSRGNYEKNEGHNRDGTATSRRSTGVNPKAAGPIDSRMPNLSPP